MKRREALSLLGLGSLSAAFDWSPVDIERASRKVREVRTAARAFDPQFFTPHEWETVRTLVDIVIPKDERSGSATDAGVPEFMDFVMTDRPSAQVPMRGGLAWLDAQCEERFGKTFVQCADAERKAVLDDIAWPKRAKPEHSHGVAFFNSFRDLTATGFWTTKMGIDDLRYIGNTFVTQWNGCPPEALAKLGVQQS